MVAIVFVLGSCMPKNGSDGGRAGPPTASQPPVQGTSDQGGGGNLIDGKPIDFYIQDITSWPEYKKYIEPIDKRFSAIAFPHNDTSILKHLAKTKTWYLLPIEKEQLPKEKIGTSFGSIQGATQTRKEIFIFEPQIPMDEVDGKRIRNKEKVAQLLLHELIMAFYRLRFEPANYFCEIQNDAKIKADCISNMAKGELDRSAMKPIDQVEFLLPEQYEPIRHLTYWIWENFQSMIRADLWEKLVEKGFDSRIFNQRTLNSVVNSGSSEVANIKRKALLKRLEIQSAKGTLPAYCGYDSGFPIKATSRCEIEFKFDDDLLLVRFSVLTANKDQARYNFSFSLPENSGIPEGGYRLLKQVFRDGQYLYRLTLDSHFVGSDIHDSSDELILYIQDPFSPEFEVEAAALTRIFWVEDEQERTEYGSSRHREEVPLKGLEGNLNLIGRSPEYKIHRIELQN